MGNPDLGDKGYNFGHIGIIGARRLRGPKAAVRPTYSLFGGLGGNPNVLTDAGEKGRGAVPHDPEMAGAQVPRDPTGLAKGPMVSEEKRNLYSIGFWVIP